jgi:hypothetical protein
MDAKEITPAGRGMTSTTTSNIIGDVELARAGPGTAQINTTIGGGGDDGQHGVDEMTFTLFPKLPPELRVRIWKFSLPGMSN